jgi:hypothetical protein
MRRLIAWWERSAALRRRCWILSKTVSVGVTSGDQGGRNSSLALGAADCLAAGIIHNDDVAGRERRHETLLDIIVAASAVERLIEHAPRVDQVALQRREQGHRSPSIASRRGDRAPFVAGQFRHQRVPPQRVTMDR